MSDMTGWAIELPDMPYPSLNNRRIKVEDNKMLAHWRRITMQRVNLVGIPPLTMPQVRLHFYPGDNRKRDRINLALVHKACVDGLVDAGVIPDDSPEYVDEMMPVIHRGVGTRRWFLRVMIPPDVMKGLGR